MLKYAVGLQRDKLIKSQQYEQCTRAMTHYIVRNIYPATLWSILQTCMCQYWRMLTCSLLTTWILRKMVVLSNICGKQFPGTERGHHKGFCDVWFWSRHYFLSLSCGGEGFRKFVQEFFLFSFQFLFIRSCSIYIFPAVVLTICKKTPTELN